MNLLVYSLSVYVTALILPGVSLDDFGTAVVVTVILGLVNTFLKPLLLLLSLPITILSLGLFTFIINALMVLLVASLIPGFDVDSFWWALLFSLALSMVSSVIFSLRDN